MPNIEKLILITHKIKVLYSICLLKSRACGLWSPSISVMSKALGTWQRAVVEPFLAAVINH